MISRTTLDVYDRRDVHTRSLVEELALQGLSVDEVSKWLENLDTESPSTEEIHRLTGASACYGIT